MYSRVATSVISYPLKLLPWSCSGYNFQLNWEMEEIYQESGKSSNIATSVPYASFITVTAYSMDTKAKKSSGHKVSKSNELTTLFTKELEQWVIF